MRTTVLPKQRKRERERLLDALRNFADTDPLLRCA